ncbi:MAG: hypothetical protein MJ252_08080, partial [archaeon]|nr:hypothetical protein [archaeon]
MEWKLEKNYQINNIIKVSSAAMNGVIINSPKEVKLISYKGNRLYKKETGSILLSTSRSTHSKSTLSSCLSPSSIIGSKDITPEILYRQIRRRNLGALLYNNNSNNNSKTKNNSVDKIKKQKILLEAPSSKNLEIKTKNSSLENKSPKKNSVVSINNSNNSPKKSILLLQNNEENMKNNLKKIKIEDMKQIKKVKSTKNLSQSDIMNEE